MPTGHYRFRRSLGNVGSLFRGARPDTYPLFSGLLDQYVGAAAAYSLRTLAASWLKKDVVEVRRASDNTSEGFTEKEITDGTLVDWVNEEIELPLDTASGAAAAYSLRNLSASGTSLTTVGDTQTDYFSFTGATGDTAALNGTQYVYGFPWNGAKGYNSEPPAPENSKMIRNLDGSWLLFDNSIGEGKSYANSAIGSTEYPWEADWTGTDLENAVFTQQRTGDYVVQVRRSSDSTIRSFTAAEVADGTLEDWVGADYVKYSSDFTSNDNDWGHFDDVAATGAVDGIGGLDGNLRLAIGSATSPHRAYRNNTLPENQEITFSARVFIPSTNSVVDGIGLFDAAGNTIINAESLTQDQWVTVTANDVTTANSQLRINLLDGSSTSFTGNSSDVVYVREITVTQTTANGHVSQWYDQSGNANHATQATDASQPKIVDAGSLVTGGMGEPSFVGDGVDDILSFSSSIDFGTGEFFVSTVVDVDTGGALIGSAVPNWLLLLTTSSIQVRASNTSAIYVISPDSPLTAGESYLISLSRVGNDITAYVNGVAQADVETVVSTDTFSVDRFLQRGTNGNPYPDPVSEIIIYPSDQSANRTAIESNIASHYSITLPTGSNTGSVDGFVSTWYDQSGNANDAVQATATSQPKIVDAGSLVSGGLDFDGVDDGLFTAGNLTDTLQSATIFALTQDDVTSGTASMLRIRPNGQLGTLDGVVWEKASGSTYGLNTVFEGDNGAILPSAGQGTRNTSKNLNTLVYQQSQILAYENGLLDETLNTVSNGSVPVGDITLVDQLWLGQNFDDNARPFNGTMSEVIVYFTDQSANRAAIETNINTKYSIY